MKLHKVNIAMMTTLCVQARGLDYLVVSLNVKTHDIWEVNVTRRSEVSTENICSLGFHDIRREVTLKKLILRSLKCKLNGTDHIHDMVLTLPNTHL
jgi:hypothetical protein